MDEEKKHKNKKEPNRKNEKAYRITHEIVPPGTLKSPIPCFHQKHWKEIINICAEIINAAQNGTAD